MGGPDWELTMRFEDLQEDIAVNSKGRSMHVSSSSASPADVETVSSCRAVNRTSHSADGTFLYVSPAS